MIPHCLPEQIHLVNLGDKALLSTYLDSSRISTHLHFSAQFSLHTVPFTRMYYPHLSRHLTSSQLLHFGWSPSTPESITWLPWWPSSDSQLKIMLHDVCFCLWSTQTHPAPWEPVGPRPSNSSCVYHRKSSQYLLTGLMVIRWLSELPQECIFQDIHDLGLRIHGGFGAKWELRQL